MAITLIAAVILLIAQALLIARLRVSSLSSTGLMRRKQYRNVAEMTTRLWLVRSIPSFRSKARPRTSPECLLGMFMPAISRGL